jgi:transcriptional regulator with XRE-family HTH domain
MTVSDWERGKSTPRSQLLTSLASELRVSVDWLLAVEDEAAPGAV